MNLKQERAQRKRQKEECRKLFSQLIRIMYYDTCAWCGAKNRIMSAHHIQRKGIGSVFLETHPMNGILLCEWDKGDGKLSCHKYCDQNRAEVEDWMKINMPTHYGFLSQTKNKPNQLPKVSYAGARDMLKGYINRYKIGAGAGQIIPRCHLPPEMLAAQIKKESGIIVPDKTIVDPSKGSVIQMPKGTIPTKERGSE